MSRLFKRQAYLKILFANDSIETREKVPNGEEPIDGEYKYLFIDFEIESSQDKKEPSKGVFNVYNLSETNRRRVETDAKAVECHVGYWDVDKSEYQFKLMFKGSVLDKYGVENSIEAPDFVTRIVAGDGYKEFTKSITVRSYASGTEKEMILKDFAKDFGIDVKVQKGALDGKTAYATAFSGLTKEKLLVYLKDNGCDYKIVDNTLNVTKKNEPIDNEAIVIAADTGLLESPTVAEDQSISFRAQLNTDCRLKKLIKLEAKAIGGEKKIRSQDYNGFYLIRKIEFVGTNYTDTFEMLVEASKSGEPEAKKSKEKEKE